MTTSKELRADALEWRAAAVDWDATSDALLADAIRHTADMLDEAADELDHAHWQNEFTDALLLQMQNAAMRVAKQLDAVNAELASVKMGCAELDRQLADAQHWRERHCRESAAAAAQSQENWRLLQAERARVEELERAAIREWLETCPDRVMRSLSDATGELERELAAERAKVAAALRCIENDAVGASDPLAWIEEIRAALTAPEPNVGCLGPYDMDAPGGPRCSCGRPSKHESGWCGTLAGETPCPECGHDDGVHALLGLGDSAEPCSRCPLDPDQTPPTCGPDGTWTTASSGPEVKP